MPLNGDLTVQKSKMVLSVVLTGHVGSKAGLLLFAGLILKQYGYC